MSELIDLRGEFHERRIAAMTARVIGAIGAKDMAMAMALWHQLKAACLSRSTGQVRRMEKRIFGRAA